ncbi:hypothetical protein [Bradyrhizobium neotropicale]|uniref:hypothetical protein n=1 Tax=Bradyrhizobium neotropicale TaxID=1497615 RepID=UPI001AD71CE9|nr:hypothetical protein [Bradyrhizobium neotropicale]MBO4227569.1 hypothetical protein [Bradyrhizobium neotropicale]
MIARAAWGYVPAMGAIQQANDPAARRYEFHRRVARGVTGSIIAEIARQGLMPQQARTCQLLGIEDQAILAAGNWIFPWRRIMGQTRPYYRRFELALWHGGNLYGLAVGRASRGPDNVTIHFLERAGGNNPFAGYFAQIALDAADRYAKLIGRQRVKLKNPASGLIPTWDFRLQIRYLGILIMRDR